MKIDRVRGNHVDKRYYAPFSLIYTALRSQGHEPDVDIMERKARAECRPTAGSCFFPSRDRFGTKEAGWLPF